MDDYLVDFHQSKSRHQTQSLQENGQDERLQSQAPPALPSKSDNESQMSQVVVDVGKANINKGLRGFNSLLGTRTHNAGTTTTEMEGSTLSSNNTTASIKDNREDGDDDDDDDVLPTTTVSDSGREKDNTQNDSSQAPPAGDSTPLNLATVDDPSNTSTPVISFASSSANQDTTAARKDVSPATQRDLVGTNTLDASIPATPTAATAEDAINANPNQSNSTTTSVNNGQTNSSSVLSPMVEETEVKVEEESPRSHLVPVRVPPQRMWQTRANPFSNFHDNSMVHERIRPMRWKR